MDIGKMSGEEIRAAGLEAVSRELGAAGLVRFVQQFESGTGDYSAERGEWLPESGVGEIAAKIRASRTTRQP